MNCIFDSIIERPEKPQRPIPQYWRQSKYSPSRSPRKSISPKLSQPKSIDKNLRKIPIAELNLESLLFESEVQLDYSQEHPPL